MTTTDEEKVGEQRLEPAPVPRHSGNALRLSAAIRVALAVGLAAAITATAMVVLWGPLETRTADVIGYPVFADFNPYNYSRTYYLAVLLFPVAALLIFYGLTWIGPRIGLATPPSGRRLRPVAGPSDADASLDPPPSSRTGNGVLAAARVAVVGVVLGLEIGVAANSLWLSVLLSVVVYSLVVGVGSLVVRRRMTGASWDVRVAAVNALGAPLTVAGLSLVSAHTQVRVLSNGAVRHYAWFPVWVGVPLAAAVYAWVLVSMRRGGAAATAALERRAVRLIAVPVGLFVAFAYLPGDLGFLTTFELGQNATGAMLMGHGWLPWRDVVLTHGMLNDVAPTAVGWGLFGNSFWSMAAGFALIFYPLAAVSMYLLLAHLVKRSWPLLVIAALMLLVPWIGVVWVTFLLWPLVLLLLAAVLERFTRVRAIALGSLVVAQAIVTPETAPGPLIVGAVVAAYEWYWRPPGARAPQAFQRTMWVIGTIVACAIAFFVYMAIRGALGDLLYVTFNLVVGHTLDGGGQPTPSLGGQTRFDFVALAPVAAVIVSFAYAAVRLRLRRPFLTADWPMGAVAVFVLFYYSKFLAKMDIGHAYQVFFVATPLMVYICFRAITALDGWIRGWLSRRQSRWSVAHPLAIAALILFLVTQWGSLHQRVDAVPADYRAVAPAAPAFTRVGYDATFHGAVFEDLRTIVDAYLRPQDKLMDITDEPALFYYLLDREPASRWYAPNGIVDTAELQRDTIGELARVRPKLIVFDNTSDVLGGLQNFDGVPAQVRLYLISRWILAHYRPLLESHGRTIYALPGARPVSSLHLRFHQQPVTAGLRFLGQECSWGYAPTFLGGPPDPSPGAQAVSVRTALVHGQQIMLTGWAGDRRTRRPAPEVIATLNGKIIARATPDTARPDVPANGLPAGFLRSGFSLFIPASAYGSKSLRIYAIGQDGSAGQLPLPHAPAQGGVARIGSRTVTLQASDTGNVEAAYPSGALYQLEAPAGSTWSAYRWLQVDAPSYGFLQGQFQLSDLPSTTNAGRLISFQTLTRSPHRYVIPASSCAQWNGYGSSRLYLAAPPGQQLGGVALIR